ncbi:putative glycolipid-binding domain-containing protein [Streptomyces sp. AC495_CC817]|uniref:putative glycolipid-binding domain-containing protein n=1 Tax=Streptomyces sp. AC495_CC817 TaxID=2823900 RepID=UPI001C25B030|nr:putative glycolipid-binding domain-containing protein [Streptomyces sp. AC495_CC817]
MRLAPLPAAASWTHGGARRGFEVAFFSARGDERVLTGSTAAHEPPAMWSVSYSVVTDAAWGTLSVRATTMSTTGSGEVELARDPDGSWTVGGEPRADLDGCADVDFESSAVTNTLPVHRIDFEVGQGIDVPAAFVRADDLRVERLEQRYTLLESTTSGSVFRYESSTFDFSCDLRDDASGLVREYPGIADRDA